MGRDSTKHPGRPSDRRQKGSPMPRPKRRIAWAMPEEPHAQEAPMSAGPTVSVVDDDPDMRSSLRWLLESVGLTARTYASAQEFLRTYQPSNPGCLVLDIRM